MSDSTRESFQWNSMFKIAGNSQYIEHIIAQRKRRHPLASEDHRRNAFWSIVVYDARCCSVAAEIRRRMESEWTPQWPLSAVKASVTPHHLPGSSPIHILE